MKEINSYQALLKQALGLACGIFLAMPANAQNKSSGDSSQYLTIDQCIVYAMQHQPAVMQSGIDLAIAKKTNAINLSGWLPQVSLIGNATHYEELPTSFSLNSLNPEGPPIKGHPGVINTVIPQLAVSEAIFNPDVMYAAKSAHLYVKQAQQSADSTKINLVASVSKTFYDLLLTLEQINILKDDTARLAKNLRDTYNQYVGGIVDKTDYKEAAIALNNSKAQLKQARENVRPQYAILKQLMGYPSEKEFSVSFDTLQMIKQITLDTAQQLQYEKRIEFQELKTMKALQVQNLNYYQSQYLPTLSVFYNYYYEYESNTVPNLFTQAYPYSYVGASLNIPLFTGFRRSESVQRAKLQGQLIDWTEVALKSRIYSEYTSALANYKSNLYDMYALKENVGMAKDVYDVVSLQYKQGVVAYLNVITAETNLISSEMNYLNALFQVLISKVDLEKAMGNTTIKH
jgi:outer membrane protein TolC